MIIITDIGSGEPNKIILRRSVDLRQDELEQIKHALFREFKVSLPANKQFAERLFFLLKSKERIDAMGALLKITPVFFDEEEFTIYAFVNVISNQQGKGYGKRVVTAMRNYVIGKKLTAIGFCFPRFSGFYEKCGLKIETGATPRFICIKDGKRTINQDGQIIFYQDGKDRFMEKVLLNPGKEVFLPTDEIW